jgi:methyl-accepting chemotaxis protein
MDNHVNEKKVYMKSNGKIIKSQKRLGTKITLSFLLIIILTIAILSTLTYSQSYNMLVKNLANRSIKIGEYARAKIDVIEFQNLKTVEDEKKEAYNSMRENLNNIKQLSGAKYIYTMRKNEDGKYAFVVDGMTLGDQRFRMSF